MDYKICFNIILFLGITKPISGAESSPANNADTAINSTETDSKTPHLPWTAIGNLLSIMGNGKTVVIFVNESLDMPTDLLNNLHNSSTKVALANCSTNRSNDLLKAFLKDLRETCRGYCIFVVQCNLPVTQHLLNNSLDFELFRPWTIWLFIDPNAITFLNYTQLKWSGVAIGVPSCDNDSDFTNASTEDICSNYTTMKVYVRNNTDNQLLATFPPISDQISANGSEIEQVIRQAQESFEGTFGKLLNMQNSTIKVAAYELPPILTIKNNTKNKGLLYEGVCMKIIEQFAKAMHFQYEISPILDIGTKIKNGTLVKWNGVMGQIRDSIVDLALGAISVTEDRLEAVDFTQHFLEDYSSIMYNIPQQRSRILIFIKVFPWQVWLMLLVAIVVLGPAFTLLEKMLYIENDSCSSTTRITIWESWWNLITSTVQKGEVAPVGVPGRALATFWLLFLLVLVGTYSGMLLATMSFPGYMPTYEYLRQFEDTSSPYPIILKPSATLTNIERAHTPAASIIQERWRKGPKVVFPEEPEEVSSYLATGNYAFLSERLIFKQIIFDQMQRCNCCPYYVAKNDFLTQYYSFMVPKNSPLPASFNIILRRLFQAGITQQWLKQSMPKTGRCEDSQSTANSEVLNAMNLTDIQGAFYTLGIGLIASLIALLVEICHSKRI